MRLYNLILEAEAQNDNSNLNLVRISSDYTTMNKSDIKKEYNKIYNKICDSLGDALWEAEELYDTSLKDLTIMIDFADQQFLFMESVGYDSNKIIYSEHVQYMKDFEDITNLAVEKSMIDLEEEIVKKIITRIVVGNTMAFDNMTTNVYALPSKDSEAILVFSATIDDIEDEDEDDNFENAGKMFYNEYHRSMVRVVRVAVEGALRTLQTLRKTEQLGFLEINANMDWDEGNIEFWYVDETNEKELQFYTHEVGAFMVTASEVMHRMEEEGGTPCSQALSNFFEDAGLSSIDNNLLTGLSFTLDVHEVGGNPYMHIVDGKELN